MPFSLTGKRVWVAGHRGMTGRAILRRLEGEGCALLTVGREVLDLRRQQEVEDWMADTRPEVVFLAAATVGGIKANIDRPADFIADNLQIQTNVIEASRRLGVAKLLFLGSSCIYPRMPPLPIREESLLAGSLEPTNEFYALAKIAGIKMCQAYRRQHGCDFVSVMPCNLYGPGDRYDLEGGHVVAALIQKIHRAVSSGHERVEVWGSGTPRREFLFVDDLADACVFVIKEYSGEDFLNIGTGGEISIRDLAERIAAVAGWRGEFVFNPAYPDGTPSKVMDVSRLSAMGWRATTPLDVGLQRAYRWYVENFGS